MREVYRIKKSWGCMEHLYSTLEIATKKGVERVLGGNPPSQIHSVEFMMYDKEVVHGVIIHSENERGETKTGFVIERIPVDGWHIRRALSIEDIEYIKGLQS